MGGEDRKDMKVDRGGEAWAVKPQVTMRSRAL